MRRSLFAFTVLLATAAAFATHALAQTAQTFSVQASVLGASFKGDENFEGTEFEFGFGGEAQVRWNPSAFSIGIGFQYTTHDVTVEGAENVEVTVDFAGAFLEPRYVFFIGSDKAAPYASARLMRLTATLSVPEADFEEDFDAFGYNAGGGVLVNLSPTINLDLGVTFGGVTFTYDDPDIESESGTSLVLRFGAAIGL